MTFGASINKASYMDTVYRLTWDSSGGVLAGVTTSAGIAMPGNAGS